MKLTQTLIKFPTKGSKIQSILDQDENLTIKILMNDILKKKQKKSLIEKKSVFVHKKI